ncbi:hypothetical protein [Rubripirellula lacrimiformis]|uniref:hypothetical protein n=1 Tax=Rubripirellula lacrimiformis TaxID=1930273 RepID=UPI0011A3A0A7|nr:hypothetical protein [Rubripirellula lacrimiformis]
MVKAAEAKRRCQWDHTADLMALMATIHTTGSYQRDHFHPLRERPEPIHQLDDPGAEYDRLMKEQA